ncbi:hypothetical protein E1B28_009545 [Marasmius oreades]|uniref:Cryptic loci regulator 2 N-terminal domain-containing protein n=1 Tax=Marasmius oreades TaxID=181124 RepID=A0A9P7RWF6_9AGAR|nr:uncharacterized protein E1B28_009545 [Marasmius oreades]KAG7090426.1 hypothetical protein E1B28_009545 [Marasmius oreades]
MVHPTSAGDGVLWVKFPRSDGYSRPPRWGKGKSWKEVKDDELSEPYRWRWYKAIGEALARAFEWNVTDPASCILSSFPQGYVFYFADREYSRKHKDVYLCGSKIFRSPLEFIEHAIWLYKDPNLTPEKCRCTKCTRTPQSEITKDLKSRGIFPEISLSQSTTQRRSNRIIRTRYPDSQPTFSSTGQETPTRSQTNPPGLPLEPERESHGRQKVTTPTRPSPEFQFRIGDLVNVLLEHTIESTNPNTSIRVWPATIVDVIPALYPQLREAVGYNSTGSDDCSDIVVQVLGFTDLQLTLPPDEILPYNPIFHDIPLSDSLSLEIVGNNSVNHVQELASLPSEFEVAAPLYHHAVRLASKIASEWSILERCQTKTLDNGETLIQANSIWLGGEELQVGDFVKVALPNDVLNELVNRAGPSPSPKLDGIFAHIYGFDIKIDTQARGEADLSVSVALFKLEPEENDGNGRMEDTGLPPPPVGFSFRLLHDSDSSEALNGDWITGRYYPNYLAQVTTEKRLDDDLLLEQLSKFWEVAGLKMGLVVKRLYIE